MPPLRVPIAQGMHVSYVSNGHQRVRVFLATPLACTDMRRLRVSLATPLACADDAANTHLLRFDSMLAFMLPAKRSSQGRAGTMDSPPRRLTH